MTRSSDISLRALYEALNAQRQDRGLSWAQATREMNGQSERRSGHALSPSTVMAMRTRTVAEGDGILQMLRWLNRTPESFVPGRQHTADERLPDIPSHQVLRFDTKKLHGALDTQRAQRNMTWRQVAKELGLGVSSLTNLAKGGRTGFPHVMRIVKWLRRPAADFVRASDW